MKFVSLKDDLCRDLAGLANADLLKGNKAFFLTPAGLVSGVLATEQDLNTEDIDALFYTSFLKGSKTGFEKELQQDEAVRPPHDGYILLRDAEIQCSNNPEPIRQKFFLLFTGSIVGCYFGNPQAR